MTIQRLLQAQFGTLVALAMVLAMFFGVEQVLHLYELPPPALLMTSPRMWLNFAAIVLMAGVYFVAAWWIVPPNPPEPPPIPDIQPGVIPRVKHWNEVWGAWLLRTIEIARGNLYRLQGNVAVALILLGVGALALPIHEPRWPFIGTWPSRVSLCRMLVLWGSWWLLTAGPRKTSYVGKMLFRVLIALTALSVLGELLWSLSVCNLGVSLRSYSIWATMHLALTIMAIGRVTDHWHRLSLLPIRHIVLVTLVIAAGLHPSSTVGIAIEWDAYLALTEETSPADAETSSSEVPPAASSYETDSTEDRWLQQLASRLDGMPHSNKPVVIVAASGGGSRAALFTSLLYEQMRRWSLDIETVAVDPEEEPAVDGQRRDPETAPTLRQSDVPVPASLADQVLLISSVSGGTLASSEYVARAVAAADGKPGFREIDSLTTSFESELRYRMNEEVDRIADWSDDLKLRALGKDGRRYIGSAKSVCEDPSHQWFHHSEFVDHICTDFMAPLLRGMLLPGQERGEAVQQFWKDHLDAAHSPLRHTNLDNHRLSEQKRRGVPLLIANVTEVDRGTALILGFPPLPPDFFGGSVARFRAFPCRELTNLDAESDLDEMFQVDLTEATRLSANFPWGFSSAKIASRGVQSRVHLIDGGVFDNTGIATIRYVFERLHDWAEAARKDGDKAGASYKLADKVMTRLRKRGVILIEIDSGAKQEPPRGLATILPGIFEPLSALENVSYTNADGVAQEHIRRLKKIFDGPGIETTLERLGSEVEPVKLREIERDFGYKLEDGNITMFHAFRVTCNHDTNVMTAWALAPSDKAKVVVQFLIERNRAAERIAQLLDIQARTSALLEQFAMPRNSNDRRPADELVRSYHDLLEFNRKFEMKQRKSDLVQQSTYATLRNKPKSRVAKTASAVGHSAPHEMVAASASRAAAAAAADESEKPARKPDWKRYESSPPKNLRLDAETQPDAPRPQPSKRD